MDSSIAFWVNQHSFSKEFLLLLKKVAYFPMIVFSFSPLFVILTLFMIFIMNKVNKFCLVMLLSALSIQVSVSIKSILKFLFSRENIYSLIHTGKYGFKWFQDFHSLSSFPSGHTIATVAFFTVLWITYPKYRFFYFIVFAVVFVTLVLLGFHFISDIIAGAFVGWTVGYLTLYLFYFFAKDEFIKMLNIKLKQR